MFGHGVAARAAERSDRCNLAPGGALARRLYRAEPRAQLALPALAQGRPIPVKTGGRRRVEEVLEPLDLDVRHRPEVLERRDPLLELDPALECLDLLVRERRPHG